MLENTGSPDNFASSQILWDSEDQLRSCDLGDLDGDGDLDLLSRSASGNKPNWYENTEGDGIFGPQQVIATSVHETFAPADLDGDGDLDLLSASGQIVWLENSDGHGLFGPERVIFDQAWETHTTVAADLDSDGDLDVLSASLDKIAWFENSDGKGTFGPEHLIHIGSHRVTSIDVADLDDDGDLDLLEGSTRNELGEEWHYVTLRWHENLLPHAGDANRDGRFSSSDLVQVFQRGEYEDNILGNSSWESGDWNGDGEFTSSDMVMAFQTGLYEVKSQTNASQIAAAVDWLFAQDQRASRQRASRQRAYVA